MTFDSCMYLTKTLAVKPRHLSLVPEQIGQPPLVTSKAGIGHWLTEVREERSEVKRNQKEIASFHSQ